MTAKRFNLSTLADESRKQDEESVSKHVGTFARVLEDVLENTKNSDELIPFIDAMTDAAKHFERGGFTPTLSIDAASATTIAPQSAPQPTPQTPSAPTGKTAERARIEEDEAAIQKFVKDNGGQVMFENDNGTNTGRIDLPASLQSVVRAITAKAQKEIDAAKSETQQVKDDAEKATKVIPTDVVPKAAIAQHIEKFKELAFTANAKDGGFHPSSFPFNKEVVIDEWRYDLAMKEFDAIETLVTPAGTAS